MPLLFVTVEIKLETQKCCAYNNRIERKTFSHAPPTKASNVLIPHNAFSQGR